LVGTFWSTIKRHEEVTKAASIAGMKPRSEGPPHIDTFWRFQIRLRFRTLAVLRRTMDKPGDYT